MKNHRVRSKLSPQISVIIPALNEEESLPFVLRDLPSHVDVVVVDNGSTDQTRSVAKHGGATVVTEPKRGYGSAVLAGMNHLRKSPPDIVVILDGDFADRPDLVHYLTQPILTDKADLVLSDRTRYAEPGALTRSQKFGNWFACRLMHAATGHRYQDMGPFRAIRWDQLERLEMRDPTWGWNVEMQMKAVQQGLRLLEVPMPYRCRCAGHSKISGDLRGSIKAGLRILWAVQHYHKS